MSLEEQQEPSSVLRKNGKRREKEREGERKREKERGRDVFS